MFQDMDLHICYEYMHGLTDNLSLVHILVYILHMDFQYNRVNIDKIQLYFVLDIRHLIHMDLVNKVLYLHKLGFVERYIV